MASKKTALILTGGGARAAYQVGVLMAIKELLPNPRHNPFPILCGTSAGAINAATLAVWAEDFGVGVDHLYTEWRNFTASKVYRADPVGVAKTSGAWLRQLAFGWVGKEPPKSLLDNAPLRQLLKDSLDFSRIAPAIESGALHSLSITCSGYTTGQSVTFYQGRADIQPWRRSQRVGSATEIGVDHLIASSAIPFIFPAIHINREWFGDGSMRQIAPVSPAIHLGADKILVIGAAHPSDENDRPIGGDYPSLAQIAGHTLSSIFLDSMSVDLERMTRINRTMRLIPESIRTQSGLNLRPIEVMSILPSRRLDVLAAKHAKALPIAIRTLMRGFGAMNKTGGALISYLLFERAYTRALLQMGYEDAQAHKANLLKFLGISQ